MQCQNNEAKRYSKIGEIGRNQRKESQSIPNSDILASGIGLGNVLLQWHLYSHYVVLELVRVVNSRDCTLYTASRHMLSLHSTSEETTCLRITLHSVTRTSTTIPITVTGRKENCAASWSTKI